MGEIGFYNEASRTKGKEIERELVVVKGNHNVHTWEK